MSQQANNTNETPAPAGASLLGSLMQKDPFLNTGASSTTPDGSPAGHPALAPLGRRFPTSRKTFTPRRVSSGGKRRLGRGSDGDDDDDNDDAMQGKDIPTFFKRPRQRSPDDPFQSPAGAGNAQFIPMPSHLYIFDTRNLYPNTGPFSTSTNANRTLNALPESARSGVNPDTGSNGHGPGGPAHAGNQQGGMPQRTNAGGDGGDGDDGNDGDDDDDDDDEFGPNLFKEKGKERMDGRTRKQTPPPTQQSFSTFATQSEVSHIRNDLHEMNHNISRLVTLMDQQTQFFSTLQARGFFAPTSQSPPAPPPANPATSTTDEQTPMDVDTPAFIPIPRRPRRGRQSEPKLKGLPTARDPDDVGLAEKIRALTRQLMKRKSPKEPITSDMLPKDEAVEDYDPHEGPCCTIQQFLPDLRSPTTSMWNQSIVELFVEHFIALNPSAPQERVAELFGGHLKYLCTKWQASSLDEKTLRLRQKLLNRSERQRNLYYRRLAVAQSYAPLRRHVPMLMALGVKGMSSDESDHSNGFAQYGVLRKEWRAASLTPWLRVFDSLYRRLRMNEVNKNTPGSQPHSRFYSDKISTRRPPVKQLPQNAYDQVWLQGLHPYDRKQLLVRDGVEYDFSHDQDIEKLAEDYNGRHNPLGLYF